MVNKMDAKKLKLIVKGENKPTFGTDPNEPWSVRAGITESEKGMLHDYLKSRGINPDFVSKDTKISHAKSSEFHKWKQDHMFDDPINYVATTVADKMKKQRAQAEEVQIGEAKTLKHTPVELRQRALDKAKRMTQVVTHNGLHKEETDKTDTITVDIPLMIRLLEYAREDAKTDMDLHSVTERLIEIRGKGMLTMADYDFVVTGKHKVKEETLDEKVKKPTGELKDACWKGYTAVGMKMKNGKKVPNCVPEEKVEEAKTVQGTALDRFRQAAAERAKKHAEIEKKQSKDGSGMSSAIDRLQKHLNKEEVEQIDELKKSTVKSWLGQQEVVPPKKPGMDRKAHNQRIKTRSKSWDRALDRLTGAKPTSEDVYQDPKAATQTAFDVATQADDTEPTYSKRKEMSKSARMIKALYKKHNMKEEIYDHEKEDKSVATYGKKPKVEKQEVQGDDDTQAAMVLKGGKTLTGQTRDTLEIDPVMRKSVKPENK